MNYRILVIDDDEPMHMIAKNLLSGEFELLHAKNAQQGIDVLAEEHVNLVLSDIHMPGMSGLEFLEALMKDAVKKQVPVLIMTNLPTVEKEKKALSLGAADFIDKSLFNEDREEVLSRIRMKLVTNVEVPGGKEELVHKKNRLVSSIMTGAIKKDFLGVSQSLCKELNQRFDINYTLFWRWEGGRPVKIDSLSDPNPDPLEEMEIAEVDEIQSLSGQREHYLANNVFSDEHGILAAYSERYSLPAEIGVPVFAVNERTLLLNEMNVPSDAGLFGFIVLKRNQLFTSEEYKVLSRLLMQTGSILWRLYSRES